MKDHLTRAQKIQNRIKELALCSDDEHHLSRIFGTKSFIACSNKIRTWMQEAGLHTYTDNAGNVRGRLVSADPDARTFVIGSHFDTVINAGKYDGVLGIITGLNLVENIIAQKLPVPFNIEIVAFCEEEGVRFHAAYLGSKAVAGSFDDHLLELNDDDGISLLQALASMERDGTRIAEDMIPAEEWLGYLEIHIEQGPVLFEKDIPVALVSAIAGQKRIEINFVGEAGHAGTVPMNMRADALAAAAHFIVAVEEYASHEKRNIVATVGKIQVPHAAINVIPGSAYCTLDLRSPDSELLSDAYEDLNKICEEICRKRRIYFEWRLIQETYPVTCDRELRSLLAKSIEEEDIEVVKLVSGAGHDAVTISQVAPVAMLFVKCFKGISHNPLENVETDDIKVVLGVGDNFIRRLIRSYEKSHEKEVKKDKKHFKKLR
ncbi:MAG: allantoate amidohydrolase [Ginsengibacter sp.]